MFCESSLESIVEIRSNGDILFSGKLISAHEFAASEALCGLRGGQQEQLSSDEEKVGATPSPEQVPVSRVVSGDEQAQRTVSGSFKKQRVGPTRPTLPLGDPRLSYSKKFFEAVNAVDAVLMKKTLDDMAIPRAVLVGTVNKRTLNASAYHYPHHFEIVGLDAIATFIETWARAVPDVEFRTIHEQIRTYANGESSIELALAVRGTQVFEIEGFPDGGDGDKVVLRCGTDAHASSVNTNVMSHIESSSSSTSSAGGGVDTSSCTRRDVRFGLGGLHQIQREFSLDVKFTFHLNANKKIFLIVSAK